MTQTRDLTCPALSGLQTLSQNLLKPAQAPVQTHSAAVAGSGIWFVIWFVGRVGGQVGFSESPFLESLGLV